MPTEREAVHEYLRLEFHLASGFIIPENLCSDCARQLYSVFTNLERLEDLLDEPVHVCRHHLTAITILNTRMWGPSELVTVIGEDLATYGWDGTPGIDHATG